MKTHRILIQFGWLTLLLGLVAGCTSTKPSPVTADAAALVCPECRTVKLGPFPSSSEWRGGPPAMVTKHECGGCRGVVTLASGPEGYRHECSVCKQSPFSCQPTHRP